MSAVGVVLSGGGMRGVAHLAVLDVLSEYGIKPTVISGTSAGAICGAFYSKGVKSIDIIDVIRKENIFHFNHIALGKLGIYKIEALKKIIACNFLPDTFEDLPIPLHVAATDIINGEVVYFSSGVLSDAIMASACIPVIFTPVRYNNTLLVDGGVLNNFPVEPLLGRCDKIIGIHVNAISKDKKSLHMHNVMERSFHLALSNSVHQKVKFCNLFIEPPAMTRFNIFDQNGIDAIYEYAYQYARSLENEILAFKNSL